MAPDPIAPPTPGPGPTAPPPNLTQDPVYTPQLDGAQMPTDFYNKEGVTPDPATRPVATPQAKPTRIPKSTVGFRITCSGTYHGSEGGKNVTKIFDDISVIFPQHVEFVQGRKKKIEIIDGKTYESSEPKKVVAHINRIALMLMYRFHGPCILRKKYGDFRGIRTIEVNTSEQVVLDAKMIASVGAIPIKEMTEADLMQYVMLADIDCVLSSYAGLDAKKIAVAHAVNRKRKADAAEALSRQAVDPEASLMDDPNVMPDGVEDISDLL